MDTLALSLSMNLQYGVPLEVLCEKLVGAKFDPAGMTMNKEIPMVKSLMDYMGRWMALKFLPKEKAKRFHNADLVDLAYESGTKSKEAFAMRLPVVDEGAPSMRFATHSETLGIAVEEKTSADMEKAVANVTAAPTKIEIAKQQGFTGSMCSGCGSFKMKRNGSCEVCLDCGATSGCS
jgi:ribonucleoside-diphosphate reductase alpha chain